MTIESHFYDTAPGVGVTEVEWAEASRSRTSIYGVSSAADLLCAAHPSTPYAVNISPAPSGFWGHGIWDTSDAVVTVTSTPPATGARRFDLVVARRDWTFLGGGPTAITRIQGSSARALPSGRTATPGELDDQPLWLVEWLGGQTQPQSITDLRLIGGLEAADALALRYMEFPGQPVRLNGATWYYEAIGNGNWAHREDLPSIVSVAPPPGWYVGPVGFYVTRTPIAGGKAQFHLTGQLIRDAEAFNLGNKFLGATIPAGYRPADSMDFHAGLNNSSNGYSGVFNMRVTGAGHFLMLPIHTDPLIEKFGNLNFSGSWVA